MRKADGHDKINRNGILFIQTLIFSAILTGRNIFFPRDFNLILKPENPEPETLTAKTGKSGAFGVYGGTLWLYKPETLECLCLSAEILPRRTGKVFERVLWYIKEYIVLFAGRNKSNDFGNAEKQTAKQRKKY